MKSTLRVLLAVASALLLASVAGAADSTLVHPPATTRIWAPGLWSSVQDVHFTVGSASRWNGSPYLTILGEAAIAKWKRLVTPIGPDDSRDKHVAVKFILDREGNVLNVISVAGNGTAEENTACKQAVTTAAPFGKWPANLAARLGDREEITLVFYF